MPGARARQHKKNGLGGQMGGQMGGQNLVKIDMKQHIKSQKLTQKQVFFARKQGVNPPLIPGGNTWV